MIKQKQLSLLPPMVGRVDMTPAEARYLYDGISGTNPKIVNDAYRKDPTLDDLLSPLRQRKRGLAILATGYEISTANGAWAIFAGISRTEPRDGALAFVCVVAPNGGGWRLLSARSAFGTNAPTAEQSLTSAMTRTASGLCALLEIDDHTVQRLAQALGSLRMLHVHPAGWSPSRTPMEPADLARLAIFVHCYPTPGSLRPSSAAPIALADRSLVARAG